MASNREQQRLLNIEAQELAHDRHRTRCHINSQMHHLRAEMYKVRVKTPSLDECISGMSLCGPSAEESQAQISSYYEIGKNGRLVKKRAAKNSPGQGKAAAARQQRSKPAQVPSTSEIQEKVTSFFERNRDLFTPAHSEHDGFRSSQSFGKEGPDPANSEVDRPQTTIIGTNFRYVSPERSPFSAKTQSTRHDEPPTAVQNAWTSTASTNPYQSLFKPDSASVRLAQQIVVVSRKLRMIQKRREEKTREDSLLVTAVEARQRARRKHRQPEANRNRKKERADTTDTDETD